ncbi:MAG: DUF2807 domain-containing protein [Anaerolineae bacterium]|nr:DUF2807 domain-containing protein [Anaerolineae bacterium]
MKQKLMLGVLIVSVLGFMLTGCTMVSGSGRLAEEDRQVKDFTGVTLAGIGTLHIDLGREESLRIEAEDNLLRYLTAEVNDGHLCIGVELGVSLHNTRPIHFYLTVKSLDSITLSGSGKVIAPELDAETLSVTVSGSGDVELGQVEAGQVRFKISGSGDMQVQEIRAAALDLNLSGSGRVEVIGGQVERQNILISGAGHYLADTVSSDEVNVRVTGSGRAAVEVQDRLDATISGSGDVEYVGQPAVVTRISGSGRVRQIGG